MLLLSLPFFAGPAMTISWLPFYDGAFPVIFIAAVSLCHYTVIPHRLLLVFVCFVFPLADLGSLATSILIGLYALHVSLAYLSKISKNPSWQRGPRWPWNPRISMAQWGFSAVNKVSEIESYVVLEFPSNTPNNHAAVRDHVYYAPP